MGKKADEMNRPMKVTGNTSAIEVSQDFQTLSNAAQVLGLESAK